MELLIVLFIGLWLTAASVLSYAQIKKDFKDEMEKNK